ncbi:GNAT family N-acetyltransferase [Micromonospora matsumotoense]|uniref:GNAT family N-acetyltransferase n=1 Tax=Micromonospora matsumotoense TaxID=121616 RepID=UPI003D8AA8BB
MTIDISPLSLESPTSIEEWVHVSEAVRRYDLPIIPSTTRSDIERALRHPWPGLTELGFVVRADGEPVGQFGLAFQQNDATTAALELGVSPNHRRRGFGRQILRAVEDVAHGHGCRTLSSDALVDHPAVSVGSGGASVFARAEGYSTDGPDLNYRLHTEGTDERRLDLALERGWAKATGYRVVSWIDRTPKELVDSVAYLNGQDTDDYHETERLTQERGRTVYHTGMVHEGSDRLVSWTSLSFQSEHPWHGSQHNTIVDPPHRGRRLGLVSKVENLRFFLRHQPQVTACDTLNAADNHPIISINEELGFVPTHAFTSWSRTYY